MYFITSFILFGLLIIHYRRDFYRLLIGTILKFISIYLYVWDKINFILPKYIYNKTYIHRTRDLNYSVYEYWGKHNNKYHKFKVIEDNFYSSEDAFNIFHPNNMNMITYCGIVNEDGDHIRDITKDIRYFMYYRGLIEWKYILVHLGLENSHSIFVCINDMDMTEKTIYISDIYNEKFNF